MMRNISNTSKLPEFGTLQKEFIDLGNFNSDVRIFNKNLTEWLIEYNFNRHRNS
ncbi:hypothetical protein KKA09_00110 [Patescibacteria group bacterium]|nr:hypothetical protein [Patescibacteria group bacterium]